MTGPLQTVAHDFGNARYSPDEHWSGGQCWSGAAAAAAAAGQ